MSQENVEIVRLARRHVWSDLLDGRRWSTRGVLGKITSYAASIRPVEEVDAIRGHEAHDRMVTRALARGCRSSYKATKVEEIIDGGDDFVVAAVSTSGRWDAPKRRRDNASGSFTSSKMREGRISSTARSTLDRAEALEAAGLSE